jgi:hypothetical protein
MPIDLPSDSRYKLTEAVVTRDGQETFGIMGKFDFLDSEKYIEYKIPAGFAGRPDLISNEVYGTPSFYWVVIMFNRPRNPLRWPSVGDIIRLPVNSVVIPEL